MLSQLVEGYSILIQMFHKIPKNLQHCCVFFKMQTLLHRCHVNTLSTSLLLFSNNPEKKQENNEDLVVIFFPRDLERNVFM